MIETELPLVQKSALPEVSPATHEDYHCLLASL